MALVDYKCPVVLLLGKFISNWMKESMAQSQNVPAGRILRIGLLPSGSAATGVCDVVKRDRPYIPGAPPQLLGCCIQVVLAAIDGGPDHEHGTLVWVLGHSGLPELSVFNYGGQHLGHNGLRTTSMTWPATYLTACCFVLQPIRS